MKQLNQWSQKGLETVVDCYSADTLMPLAMLIEEYELPAGQFLNYKALSRAFQTRWGNGTNETHTHEVLQLLLTVGL